MSIIIIKPKWIKGIYFFFALLFLLSAAVQYNDPDPIHWIFLYGFSAIVCLLAVFGRLNSFLIFICLGAVILQLLIVFEGALEWYRKGGENILSTPMSNEKPYIEEVREFFGALIVLVANLSLLYFRKNKSHSLN